MRALLAIGVAAAFLSTSRGDHTVSIPEGSEYERARALLRKWETQRATIYWLRRFEEKLPPRCDVLRFTGRHGDHVLRNRAEGRDGSIIDYFYCYQFHRPMKSPREWGMYVCSDDCRIVRDPREGGVGCGASGCPPEPQSFSIDEDERALRMGDEGWFLDRGACARARTQTAVTEQHH